VLYAAELAGLLLIWSGYLANVRDTASRSSVATKSQSRVVAAASAGD
jgi:hypothetical protein